MRGLQFRAIKAALAHMTRDENIAMHDLGDPQWTLELLRCRGGRPRSWQVTWRAGMESLMMDDEARTEEAPRRARRH